VQATLSDGRGRFVGPGDGQDLPAVLAETVGNLEDAGNTAGSSGPRNSSVSR
jgi:hypothetical protein